MSKVVAPSAIAESIDQVSFTNLDMEKAILKFENDPTKFLILGNLKLEKHSVKVSLTGEMVANGLLVSEFDGKKNFSLALTLDETDDLEGLEKISEKLISMIPDSDEYSFSSFVREEKLYLKLKLGNDKKSFMVKNNLKLNPNKMENTGLYRGQRVDVVGEIGVYVNIKDKKAGLTFTPRKIQFEVDFEEPATKKQKK